MREICTSGSTRGGAPIGPLLLYRLSNGAVTARERLSIITRDTTLVTQGLPAGFVQF